jgi:hypothetical protein
MLCCAMAVVLCCAVQWLKLYEGLAGLCCSAEPAHNCRINKNFNPEFSEMFTVYALLHTQCVCCS